jgi:pimeloyl-ACP methyl ester carboxylesterase
MNELGTSRGQFVVASAIGLVGSAFTHFESVAPRLGDGAATVDAGSGTTFESLKQIDAGELSVGYADVGPAHGTPVMLLHGWPYDIHSYLDAAALLAAAGYRVFVPYLRGYGTTRFLSDATPRNGQQAALVVDALNFLDAMKLDKAILGGFDWGGRTACALAALWPERVTGLVAVSGYTIASQKDQALKPLPPSAEREWWYSFYFATERGRLGYGQFTRDFVRLTWELASPKWKFSEATFERSAPAFENPDHVTISVDSYRWRFDLAEGERKYDDIEAKLATHPTIGVPSITLEGDANGALHPEPASYRKYFTGKYQHRQLTGGIGHNLPQEAPSAFAQAIKDVG